MRKAIATTLTAIAAFLLILCILFTCIQIAAGDTTFYEQEFKTLKLDEKTGLDISTLSAGIQRLIDYMYGRVDSIDLTVVKNGESMELYSLEIEHVHMVDVRALWQLCRTARNAGLVVAALLYMMGVLICPKDAGGVFGRGTLYGAAVFGFFAAFLGTWAGLNFTSFWTLVHRILFPGTDTWLLPGNSMMITMLPEELFSALVLRAVLYALAGLVVLLLVAILFARRSRRRSAIKYSEADLAAEQAIRDAQPKPVEDGPDLLAVHKRQNMPVRMRGRFDEAYEREKAIREDVETFGKEESEPASPFDPYTDSYDGETPAAPEPVRMDRSNRPYRETKPADEDEAKKQKVADGDADDTPKKADGAEKPQSAKDNADTAPIKANAADTKPAAEAAAPKADASVDDKPAAPTDDGDETHAL